ncbi:MAG: hypothetical protein JWM27_568 [Gemmatimonadetes bacterium]|nr:hypothetical protein [Gemmatimonadota bacterium]
MSVFSFPRFHVKGLMEVNVGNANNDDYSGKALYPEAAGGLDYGSSAGEPLRLYDSVNVQAIHFGWTDEQWMEWVQKPQMFVRAPDRNRAAALVNKGEGPAGVQPAAGAGGAQEPGTSTSAAAAEPKPPVRFIPGEWNFYGDMGLTMMGVKVIGVDRKPGGAATADPLMGAELSFNNRPGSTGRSTGMLIDVNSEDVPSSQVFADFLTLAQGGKALFSGKPCKAVTRWINFLRNAYLNASNGAAGTFQCVVPLSELAGQPILEQMPAKDPQGRPLAGVLLRYVMYRPLQPINVFNHDPEAWFTAMTALYAKAANPQVDPRSILNPDYVELGGTIAPWYEGELKTIPAGRFLATTGRTIPLPAGSAGKNNAGGGDPPPPNVFTLAPATVFVDRVSGWVSVDCATAFPDAYQATTVDPYNPLVTGNNPKVSFGTVELQLRAGGSSYRVGTIDPADTAGGDRRGWIWDFPIASLPQAARDALDTGDFCISSAAYGDLLMEQEYVMASDQACIYAEQAFGNERPTTSAFTSDGLPAHATFRMFRRGKELTGASAPPVTVWEYDTTPNNAPGSRTKIGPLAPGEALSVNVTAPGNRLYTFTVEGQPEPPLDYGHLSLGTAPMINLRILPNAQDYHKFFVNPGANPPTGNALLTWDVIYREVLRTFYLLYPAMSLRVPLNDPDQWRGGEMAGRMFQRTQAKWWAKAEYMPRTRDLSASRRRLLQGWCMKFMGEGGAS